MGVGVGAKGLTGAWPGVDGGCGDGDEALT